jgi:hypothetical protein
VLLGVTPVVVVVDLVVVVVVDVTEVGLVVVGAATGIVVDVTEPVTGGTVVDGAFVDLLAGVGATSVVEVVVVEEGVPVSGEAQPDGGSVAPCWPGISTVPAQPKSDSVTSRTTVPPSEKRATESTSRM